MILFKMTSSGHTEQLQRFYRMGPDLNERLMTALEYLGGELQAVMYGKASGLHSKSGKLRRSFYHVVSVRQGGQTFVLTTGVRRRAYYAAFQDKGVPRKEVEVRQYTRHAAGRDTKEGRRRFTSGVDFVQAYRRAMYINPEPFIGVSLEQMRSEIVRTLREAVTGVTLGS